MAIIQSGSFVSDGTAKNLSIRSDLDFMMVMNATELAAGNGNHGVQYFWQRGFAANDGVVYLRNAAATAVNVETSATLVVDGFTLFDDEDTVFQTGASVATTGISNANPPLVSTGDTTGLHAGDTVRIINAGGALQISGMDFTINNITANTSFALQYMAQIVNAPNPGHYRKVLSPSAVFYPRWRYIAAATGVSSGGVTTVTVRSTVENNYNVGQEVRFVIPEIYGYSALNGTSGVITSITNAATFVVRLDQPIVAGAITFPLTADAPFSQAIVVPMGEGHGVAGISPNTTNDATLNLLQIGITLAAGITSPAGSNNDVIYWQAFKADN